MKNKYFSTENIIAIALLVLTVALLNPFGWWMPDMMVTGILVALFVGFSLFAGLIWKENARDERETLHRMFAGRVAFLAGVAVLLVGISVQGISHSVDPWLVGALGAMMLAKIFGLLYGQKKH